jgi:cytochrome P450
MSARVDATVPRLRAPRLPAAQLRAQFHEFMIYARCHPLPLLLAETTRRIGDVVRVPGVGYVVNDPAVAKAILLDDDSFTKSGPGSMGAMITQVLGESALLNMDGEAHRALRGKLSDLFSAAYLDRVCDTMLKPLTDELASGLEAGNTIDMVRFMHRLSGKTTCDMLGVVPPLGREDETYAEIFQLGARVTAMLRLTTMRLSPEQVRTARALTDRLGSYADACFDRQDPGSDSIIDRLRQLGLSRDETKSIVAVMMVVGTETVSTALPRILALLIDSGQLGDLRADPSLLRGAIDEGLRCVVPSPVMLRSAVRARVLAGHRFLPGRRVMILTYNLLKHRRYFADPRRYDVRRVHDPEIAHLWFGAGPHFCLGYALAHRELAAVLNTFATLSRPVRITRRRYARGVLIPAYASLEVKKA